MRKLSSLRQTKTRLCQVPTRLSRFQVHMPDHRDYILYRDGIDCGRGSHSFQSRPDCVGQTAFLYVGVYSIEISSRSIAMSHDRRSVSSFPRVSAIDTHTHTDALPTSSSVEITASTHSSSKLEFIRPPMSRNSLLMVVETASPTIS